MNTMMRNYTLFLVVALTVLHAAFAVSPPPTLIGCDFPKVCGGPKLVAASVVIAPKVINGQTIKFFACQCLNGTRAAVSYAGDIIIPIAAAPSTGPAPATHGPSKAPAPSLFDAAHYANSLKTSYPTLCNKINVTELGLPGNNPAACKRPIVLGQICLPTCKSIMLAVGPSCYGVAFTNGTANPALVHSNMTVVYDQCTRGVPYTTAAQWTPAVTPGLAPSPASSLPLALAPQPQARPSNISPSPAPSSATRNTNNHSTLSALMAASILLLLTFFQ